MVTTERKVILKKNILPKVRKIFEPSHVGVAYFPGMLGAAFQKELVEELHGLIRKGGLSNFPKKGRYRFASSYAYGSRDLLGRGLKCVAELVDAFTDRIYTPLAELVGFTTYPVNEISILRYKAGKGKLQSHQDLKEIRGVSAVFTVTGKATFNAAPEDLDLRPVKGKVSFEVSQGGLTLIRGHELNAEVDIRPFHELINVQSERFAIAMGPRFGGYNVLRFD